MNDADKAFFEQLAKEAEKNPFIRIEAAANEVAEMIKRSCTDSANMVKGDLWLYLLSVLAGASCARAGASNDKRLLVENMDNPQYMQITKLGTDAGNFYIGDAINEYLFYNRYSVWNVISSIYGDMHKDAVLPDVKETVNRSIANIGKKDYRIWDNLHNPYEERPDAASTYNNIEKHLEPFGVKSDEMPAVYGIAIAQVIKKVEGIFPKTLNCLEMVLETVVYNAHMEYL